MSTTRWTRRSFLAHASAAFGLWATSTCAVGDEREVPWLAEVQRSISPTTPVDTGYFEPLLTADDGTPITTLVQWRVKRASIQQRWLDFLGPMPARPAIKLEVLSETVVEGCRRVRVRYECEPEQFVEAYVLYPEPLGSLPKPAVVAFHSTTTETIDEVAGVKGRDSRAIGLQLAREGFVVICPQCFLWQDPALDYDQAVAKFQARNPGALGMRKMLNDGQAAVDVLCSLPEVDPSRIGAVGHSLGAKETLYLAAFDERIRAAVASEGGIGLGFTNWHDPWYLGRGIQAPEFKLNHHQLLALIAPRAFLVLAGESGPATMSVADGDRCWPHLDAAKPVYQLYGNPARLGLYNHRQGHTIPPEAAEKLSEWLRVYV